MKRIIFCRLGILSVAALLVMGCFLSFSSGKFVSATDDGAATSKTIPGQSTSDKSAPSKMFSEADFAKSESIIVETNDPEALEEYGDVTKISSEIYVVDTGSKEAAADAADTLDKKESIKKILPDFEVEAQTISYDGMYSWGVGASGLDHYTDWLELAAENGDSAKKHCSGSN